MHSSARLLSPFRSVFTSLLFPTLNGAGVQHAAHDMIPNPWKILDSPAANNYYRVLLKIMADPWDVSSNFVAIGQTNAGDFAQSRVRLLRGHRPNLNADTALE